MRRLASILCVLLFVTSMRGQSASDGSAAVVRLPSHGCSATVIFTEKDRTYLLSCGHGFEGRDRDKPITVDLPASRVGRPRHVGITLVDVDYHADLSLIRLHTGPVEFVCPVAPHRHRPGTALVSVGYDEMRLPAVRLPARIVLQNRDITYTAERPWHGRSGGALIDTSGTRPCVIGVVSGYETDYRRRGIYVSHAAIVRFLDNFYEKGQGGASPQTYLMPRGFAPSLPIDNCPIGH
jgi:hypothetical protein